MKILLEVVEGNPRLTWVGKPAELSEKEKEFIEWANEHDRGCSVDIRTHEKIYYLAGDNNEKLLCAYWRKATEYGIEMTREFKQLSYQARLTLKEREREEEQRKIEAEKVRAEIAKHREEKARQERKAVFEKMKCTTGCLGCPNSKSVWDDFYCTYSRDKLNAMWLDPNLGYGFFKEVGIPNQNCKYAEV